MNYSSIFFTTTRYLKVPWILTIQWKFPSNDRTALFWQVYHLLVCKIYFLCQEFLKKKFISWILLKHLQKWYISCNPLKNVINFLNYPSFISFFFIGSGIIPLKIQVFSLPFLSFPLISPLYFLTSHHIPLWSTFVN